MGDKLEGVILYVDPSAVCVELSLQPTLVKAVKNFQDNKYSQASGCMTLAGHVDMTFEFG